MNQASAVAPLTDDVDEWVANRLSECRRQVLHHEARANLDQAKAWKRAERAIDYALAMFMAKVTAPPVEDKPADLAKAILRDIAKNGEHDPSRIEAIRILLSLEGVSV